MKTCARCRQVRPDDSFVLNKNYTRHSWCRTCTQDAKHEWKKHNRGEYNAYKRALEQVRKGPAADPAKYTQAVCERITGVTQRAITRWERHTGSEAPPHLTAIIQLAQQIAADQEAHIAPHPRRIRFYHTCLACLTPFSSGASNSRYCSTTCKQTYKHKRRHDRQPSTEPPPSKKQRTQELVTAKRAYRETEGALIRLYRELGVNWQTIADKFEIPGGNPGNAYHRAYYRGRT